MMKLLRFLVTPVLLALGSCTGFASGCSAPEWPFYVKAVFKDRPFHLIGGTFGPLFMRPEGCDFLIVGAGTSEAAVSAIRDAIDSDRLGRDTVIGGRFDGEIVQSDTADDPVVVITNVRDLHVLDGKERHDVLDSRYLPPRRRVERDPSKPIVSY